MWFISFYSLFCIFSCGNARKNKVHDTILWFLKTYLSQNEYLISLILSMFICRICFRVGVKSNKRTALFVLNNKHYKYKWSWKFITNINVNIEKYDPSIYISYSFEIINLQILWNFLHLPNAFQKNLGEQENAISKS